MLQRLQRKTLIPAQIVGYALTLLVGAAIMLLVVQLYYDIKPILSQQTDVLKPQAVTVSKKVTVFKNRDKSKLGFSEEEVENLKSQKFVKRVGKYNSATFEVSASIQVAGGAFQTEMFFESVPDDFIDVVSERWKWNPDEPFVPIIIPEDYLNLYNFGFAESQSMPLVSQNLVEQVPVKIYIDGNGGHCDFKGGIVGFSNAINTILVPEDFLEWANNKYGRSEERMPTRLLVEFTDSSDERIPEYFKKHNLEIKERELQASKLMFFFKLAVLFVFSVSIIIVVLSLAFIIMSMNLIVQKNHELFVNLYNIGYSPKQISRFYQLVISIITFIDILLAAIVTVVIRLQYINRLSAIFNTKTRMWPILISTIVIAALVLVVYNILIRRTITKTVKAE